VAVAVIVAAAFGGTSKGAVKGASKTLAGVNTSVKGKVSFDGIWTSSTGQKPFQAVINAFQKRFPNVHVNYKPVGNNLPTVLATAVAGGHPPDMADIAQPGHHQAVREPAQAQADHVRVQRALEELQSGMAKAG